MARTEPDGMGNPPYSAWAPEHPDVTLATFADAAADAELIVNATSGDVSIDGSRRPARRTSRARCCWTSSNPLDFSKGFPPTLFVKDTDSLGEQIQAAFPERRWSRRSTR